MTFWLRDFISFGDSVRIKLPHIDWVTLNDVKNQYLWLENRQLLRRRFDSTDFEFNRLFDINKPLLDRGCFGSWTPGLHAAIQIGKDTKGVDVDGNGINVSDIAGDGAAQHPAELGSYLFSADGRGQL